MDKDGKWRFTSPTHVVLAFAQALREMEAEGGIPARSRRYRENNRLLISKMEELGIRPYIGGASGTDHYDLLLPGTSQFFVPGYVSVYQRQRICDLSGKSNGRGYIPISEIYGEIYKEDIEKLCEIIKQFLEEEN